MNPILWLHTPFSQPTPTAEPEEDEEDEELGKYCHYCDEMIPLVELAVQVKVVIGFKENPEHVQCFDVLDDDGDYKYTPLHFHGECWEILMDDVRTLRQDEPPIIKRNEAIRCSVCDSSIEEGEEFSSVSPGEIHVSPRQPSDKVETEFFEYGRPQPTCFGCMSEVDQLLEYNGSRDDDEEDE